ncbi:hypothetical protein D3C80_2109760 [compost metagenome]
MSAEIGIEILFAGQVSAPRGFPVGAVTEGTQYLAAARIRRRLQQRVPGSRAAELHLGVGGDPAVITR